MSAASVTIRRTRITSLLGTSTGQLFSSNDGGRSWSRFAHLGASDDYVLDHIAIDSRNPNTIFVAAWSVENQQAGDLFRTNDGGKNWEALPAMHGKSIRALAMAASDSQCWSPALWTAFIALWMAATPGSESPLRRSEVKNIESIAVDPTNPNLVYAGSWHLPWKTTDGGATWQHINKGMIEDSDVFSIIVDASNPATVFASACSGIYKSQTGWRVVPEAARHSFHGAAHARSEAGSEQPLGCLCRNYRRAVENRRLRQDLETHERSGSRGE